MTHQVNTIIDNAVGAVVVGVAAIMFVGPFALVLLSPAITGF